MFAQIEAYARPKMRAYFTDLEIDRKSLEKPGRSGVPFLHGTRDTGTLMLYMYPASYENWPAKGQTVPHLFGYADRYQILESLAGMAEAANRMASHSWLYFDGVKIREVSAKRAEAIAREWKYNTLQAWK